MAKPTDSASKDPRTWDRIAREIGAVRAYFGRDRPSQRKVAKQLAVRGKSAQAQISKDIWSALEEGILEVRVHTPRLLSLEKELEKALRRFGIREVRVVPNGPRKKSAREKNADNLGDAGARFVMERIIAHPSQNLRITLSCGETLRVFSQNLIDLLNDVPTKNSRSRKLQFYPAACYPGDEVSLLYPSTLLTTIAVMTGPWVSAFAPHLPANFYSLTDRERVDYLSRFQILDVMKTAGDAGIFVLGIGRIDDPAYQSILGTLNESDPSTHDGEIVYIPITRDGGHHESIASKIVGISLETLRNRSRSPDVRVLGIAGGKAKREAIEAALSHRCLNALVTDETNASYLIQAASRS